MRSQRDSFMACTNLEGEETAFSTSLNSVQSDCRYSHLMLLA